MKGRALVSTWWMVLIKMMCNVIQTELKGQLQRKIYMFLLHRKIFSYSCTMHSNNFIILLCMSCFQVIAGQTWQNVTSKKSTTNIRSFP